MGKCKKIASNGGKSLGKSGNAGNEEKSKAIKIV